MRIHILVLLLLACFGVSYGQQRPGLAGNVPAPAPPGLAAQSPGEQDSGAQACKAELARLQRLADDQRSYIALLEQKVESLQPTPATGKGKGKAP
jgi:hypothetical protein